MIAAMTDRPSEYVLESITGGKGGIVPGPPDGDPVIPRPLGVGTALARVQASRARLVEPKVVSSTHPFRQLKKPRKGVVHIIHETPLFKPFSYFLVSNMPPIVPPPERAGMAQKVLRIREEMRFTNGIISVIQ